VDKTVSLTGSSLTGADAGNYTLSLAGAPTTTADITAPDVTAGHGSGGYHSPTTNMTVTNVFAYPAADTLAELAWTPALPAGWALTSASGDGAPSVAGTNVVFGGPLTDRPIEFSYTVTVPAGEAISNVVSATAAYRLASMAGDGLRVAVTPDPLAVNRYHSADYRLPYWVIDGTEVNRVLAYWRAGDYYVEPMGHDGYAPGAGSTAGHRHAADYLVPHWEIGGSEANRALAYWRDGGYRVDASGDDGYAAASSGPGAPPAAPQGGGTAVTQSGPARYDPGGTVTITNTFSVDDALLSLCWKPELPDGWTVVSVNGDGRPELLRGDILWVGRLPNTPIQMVYIARVPLWELGARTIGAEVGYYGKAHVNALQSKPAPDTLVLVPRDDDGDGMPDAWEDYYTGGETDMLPDSDDDGDGMVNRHECIAGTDPRDRQSVLSLGRLGLTSEAAARIWWQSAANRRYSIGRATRLRGLFQPVATNIPATPPWNSFEDATDGRKTLFYRIEVEQ